MTKRMLIDATHAEETRVVVLDGSRLEDFDVETSTKKQLKGNIYLAKVVRVEPSLQAAFVEYGGGRHGFLAFGEIHPDYYQIPVADRQRLLALQAEEAREEAEAEDAAAEADARHGHHSPANAADDEDEAGDGEEVPAEPTDEPGLGPVTADAEPPAAPDAAPSDLVAPTASALTAAPLAEPEGVPELAPPPVAAAETVAVVMAAPAAEAPVPAAAPATVEPAAQPAPEAEHDPHGRAQPALIEREQRFGPADGATFDDEDGDTADADIPAELPPPETIGGDTEHGDAAEEARARRTSRFLRNYRIQEVIRRRQILLVQVVKEERGTKGAALTTYISLAGRYCVLMPNSPRGGGISRKITSAADRRRLKEITAELDIPTGMGLIVRTAGANRPKPEIKRDCEYLMRLWDDIREHTLRSVAPALIYEEASLIKRAIRDVYSRDVDEVIVDGEEGWKAAHDFMRMLMPSHAKKVQLWRGNGGGANQPLFAKHMVEAQLDAMLSPTVQLRSGGYLVINQTEALVAIDVNSGRSTRERGIEETALRTNLEAADEVARQLRLRDLAGLIVIDFIDMDAKKHNAAVERRLKDALKIDRARIQVGHISHFGLMEMSRQRLRPSLAETSFVACPHCGGLGHVRSTESSAIHVLRAIEEEGAKGRAALIMVHVASACALYLLNHKRERLAEIEARYAMRVHFTPDDSLVAPQVRIDRLRPQVPEAERPQIAAPVAPAAPAAAATGEDAVDEDDIVMEEDAPPARIATAREDSRGEARGNGHGEARSNARPPRGEAPPAGEEGGRRRRRRRRRNGRREAPGGEVASGSAADADAEEFDEGDDAPESVMVALDEAGLPPPLDEAADTEAGEVVASDQPSLEAADLDENGLPRPRRRGRRGGRRRRRGEDGAEAGTAAATPAPVHAAPAYTAPVYTGPTPADPFGSGPFDIFDMMDQADDFAPAPSPPPAPVAAVPAEANAAPAPTAAPEAVELAVAEAVVAELSIAEPAVAEAAIADAATLTPPAAAPATAESLAVAAVTPDATVPAAMAPSAPEPVAAAAAAEPMVPAAPPDPVVGPAIKPIVIGLDEVAPSERKRGWWKR